MPNPPNNPNDTPTIPDVTPPFSPSAPSSQPPGGGPLHRLWMLIRRVLAALLGTYTPPPWMHALLRGLGWPLRALLSWMDRNPRQAWSTLAVLFALGAGSYGGWLWWKAQPKPLEVTFTITTPGATPLVDNAVPDRLVVSFSSSAAPLDLVGKTVERGISLAPSHEGAWMWSDDHTLVFTPGSDWPVGQRFNVRLLKGAVPDHVVLAESAFSFTTAAFTCSLANTEFYQDPTDAKVKRAVATLRFSHPVDGTELQKRVQLTFSETQPGMRPAVVRQLPFRINYDRFKGEASIQSDALSIPQLDSRVEVVVQAGVRSSRGGSPCDAAMTDTVPVPGMYTYFHVQDLSAQVAQNERLEPEHVLVLQMTDDVREGDVRKAMQAWVLPRDLPAVAGRPAQKDHTFGDPAEVGPEVLRAARELKLDGIPAERETAPMHSWRFDADPGQQLYVRLKKGLSSRGGYVLGEEYATVITVPAFPRELALLHDGTILTLSGEHTLTVMSRGLNGVEMDVARILPSEVNHLISQSGGDMRHRYWKNYAFNEENISEKFTETRNLAMTRKTEAQYTALNLSRYLGTPVRHGVFWLRVRPWEPPAVNAAPAPKATADEETVQEGGEGEGGEGEEGGEGYEGGGEEGEEARIEEQQRLVLVTDLGVVAKDNADGTHELYVMSFSTGEPMGGATVAVLGKNGAPVVSRTTDATGHASVPNLQSYTRERTPLAYLVTRGDDLSFLPLHQGDRRVDTNRFDVGGIRTGGKGGALDAYVFSDRGIYRPGDAMHVGMIVKSVDWARDVTGLPLEAVVADPRGVEVDRQKMTMPAGGFVEVHHRTQETSPTGNWTVSIHILKDNQRSTQLGSVEVRVEEFLPDRMKMTVGFAAGRPAGWLSPKDLAATVNLKNLFGAPAQHHRVTARMALTPATPSFARWKDHTFFDPMRPERSHVQDLDEVTTDDQGDASLPLDLQNFDAATWRVRVAVEGFELEGGRSVKGEAGVLVSPLEHLVGYKADGELGWVKSGTARTVSFVAVNSALDPVGVSGLTADVTQEQYVSVLTSVDGLYRYQSVRREVAVSSAPLDLGKDGTPFKLPTQKPGNHILRLHDKAGVEVAVLRYTVAGEANLSRNLEKNAELSVKAGADGDVAAGESLQLNIVAPYTGAGLITLERDRVYAHTWFKARKNASVQSITVPRDLEGTAYVHVTFVRAPDSPEIFSSPLSSSVLPISISRARRTVKVTVDAPELVQPGTPLKMKVNVSRPSRVVVWAVDEGILQVARYSTPDPLEHFFRKRALEVNTDQLLDLLLPEYSVVRKVSKMGGDGSDELGANLNPFKRKRDEPVAFWSGILDVGTDGREVTYNVPPSFNGSVRIMAVAVATDGVGAFRRSTLARSDFVMAPNTPTFLAPGDETVVTLGVTNMKDGSGKGAKPTVKLTTSPHLEVLDGTTRDVELPEGTEKSVSFRVRAKDILGGATLTFVTSLGDARSTYVTSLSVRPPVPYRVSTRGGHFKGTTVEVPVERAMHDEFRTTTVTASPLPLSMAQGLLTYLRAYPYGCTEQLVSQAFPALVLRNRKEFGNAPALVETQLAQTLIILRSRQNDEGAFGMWAANAVADPYHAVYATLFLLEARERNEPVPKDLLDNALAYVRTRAARESNSLWEARIRAFALYVLARAGEVHGPHVAALRDELKRAKGWSWEKDVAAVFLASTHKLLQQNDEANARLAGIGLDDTVVPDVEHYYDRGVRNGLFLYLLARHFPEAIKNLSGEAVAGYAQSVLNDGYHSLSAAWAILGLDAYATAVGTPEPGAIRVLSLLKEGKGEDVPLPSAMFATADFPAASSSLKLQSDLGFPIFWSTTQAGFDVSLPQKPLVKKLEVTREFVANGNKVTEAAMGDELEVRVSVRGLEGDVHNLAVVDLIPAGFEVVLNPGGSGASRVLVAGPHWVTYADVREDRVVLYGRAGRNAQSATYRIKATNRGTYKVPPTFAEDMYDRGTQAMGLGGTLTVK